MARFFIDRPVFAWVIAIVIMVAGILSIRSLPIAQYPSIAPPQIAIGATYPGASAKTLEDSVTQVIEQRMTGIDNLRYLESQSDSAGNVTITLTFEAGTNPDIAQVQVQNKLALATPLLPQEVQQLGVRVTKSVRNFLMVIGFRSIDGSMTEQDIGDFVTSRIQEPLSRVPGVGEIQSFGTQYAMRIWLDADKLNNYGLMPSDVSVAIRAQNAQVSAGQLGGNPAAAGQLLNATITAQTRLETPEQFEKILLRVNADGSRVLLRDVARVELGGESYDRSARFSGKPASGMAIRPATGANALETVAGIRAKIDELKPFFPQGLEVVYPLDTTPFVRLSVEEVVKTLVEAVILVFLVMYLFLQNIRATLIPTIAVPVVLLGTFAIMALAGFSINTLTLFGVVLAIGLLVDDAIVVVENVERVMSEEGLSPKEATKKSMRQITGALIGIGLVLSAVFIPMAFFGGSTGVIYRQFSITIVSAMALSVIVAIVLTPALCATMLRPVKAGHHHEKRGFFGWFNRTFDRGTTRYASGVTGLVRRSGRSLLMYALIVGGMIWLFSRIPTGFLPDEDQGILFAQAQLPPGSTSAQTLEVLKKMEQHFLVDEAENVDGMFGVTGFSFSGFGQNQAFAFIRLKDWEHRSRADQKVKAVQGRALAKFSQFKEAFAFAFAPPAVLELGTASGFDLRLTDNASQGHEALMAARNQLLGLAGADQRLRSVRPNGLDDNPQFKLDIDQEKASALGISLADINSTLASAWGSSYVNDFIDRGRVKKVYLQADAPFRMMPEDINRWYVRNRSGEMVPFSSFSSAHWTVGSPKLERFNGVPSVAIIGEPAAGTSSGQAMQVMTELSAKLPPGFGLQWSGLSYEERLTGSQGPALYAISILIVFLCLAALYESWAIPAAVLMIVPLGVVGTLLAALFRDLPNDVYFQVGLLTIVGLSAKNAILIVEFAKENFDRGMSLMDAAAHAARQRLRPILMTSLAFGLGVLPLAIASGAGSGSQNAIGTGVIGGTITATILGIFFVPLFFVTVLKLFRVKPIAVAATTAPEDSRHA
ncbi:hydrophobe/amphiphile efflux-1 family RND transporter [Nibricoccus aquaticus]|uniref:Hydrophobe/amphiphile efflux-1 family RND transporter n=1 Tax=Nibricoccus aquaticus TaxID=2576891 RepID=A0A290QIY1_9BACT|nr:efflux RND transporter permease subunit [Nibricoccus aquaticus]ATC64301.1 hydrophobe/amphiphile efflux-1 family RND transporter [Nibricoccus aquaticus]